MHVSEAARLLGANYCGQDRIFMGCSIDSRTLPRGALFVALRGQHRDGHDFVNVAAQKGAAAAMVEHADVFSGLPVIEVGDCHYALRKLAGVWRNRFNYPLVAITGSNGKTTVKELLASIFKEQGPTHATQGNLNNELGVPLTLLGLDQEHRWAVLEMGANHPDEIRRLTYIARPTIGVITRCAPAHLEGFGSIEGVAKAKGELFESMTENGVAIINADDPYANLWERLVGSRRKITFGLGNPADVSADYRLMSSRGEFMLKTPIGCKYTQLNLPGRHNILNALAAAAAAIAAGCGLDVIVKGLMSAGGVDGRLRIKYAQSGARIIDDTYNANSDSLAAALEVLADYQEPRWLVLGEMGELGDAGPKLHDQAGMLARKLGVTRIFATGNLCRYTVNAFGSGGNYYSNAEELLTAVRMELTEEATVLVKGSRYMRMERVADGLLV